MAETIGEPGLWNVPPATAARRVVASCDRYAEAEETVDYLLDHGLPAKRVAIVASDLSFVEEVTARAGYLQAGANGAAAGALIGVLFGFVAGSLRWVEPLVAGLTLGLYGLVLGGIVGAVAGLALHAAWRGRDFSTLGRLEARHYDVMVNDDRAADAVELLEDALAGRSGSRRSSDGADGEGPPLPAA